MILKNDIPIERFLEYFLFGTLKQFVLRSVQSETVKKIIDDDFFCGLDGMSMWQPGGKGGGQRRSVLRKRSVCFFEVNLTSPIVYGGGGESLWNFDGFRGEDVSAACIPVVANNYRSRHKHDVLVLCKSKRPNADTGDCCVAVSWNDISTRTDKLVRVLHNECDTRHANHRFAILSNDERTKHTKKR